MQETLLNLPRKAKQLVVIALDIVLVCLATWLAYSLRFDGPHIPINHYQWLVYPLALVTAIPVFIKVGLYRAVFRYTGLAAMNAVLLAITLHTALFSSLLFWLAWPLVPRSLGLLQPSLLLILVATSRAAARFWLTRKLRPRIGRTEGRLLIYGTGPAGIQISLALQHGGPFELVGFLDDDQQLQGKVIYGQTVFPPIQLSKVIERYGVTDVLLAMPDLTRQRRNEILSTLQPYNIHIRSLPALGDLAQGKVSVSDIRELDIEDLLGRDPVPPDPNLLGKNIAGKTVLVTGAGGSIGSELCRQILSIEPTRLLLVEHNEFGLYTIHAELTARGCKTEIIPLLGSVRDYPQMLRILKTFKPQTVYHAAAYKHVPLVEHNISEGVRNNIFGTLNIARAAIETGASDFVLISTDKAVRPTNVMGATKRTAELVLQALSAEEEIRFDNASPPVPNQTRLSMVRFGNVLGSSGSVVPLFRKQIRDGGPVTVTHAEVTRYFMTIPEAAQLVIQAGAMATGGDVFVLDMGEPVRIIDLAHRMVELSGLTVRNEATPDGDIEIHVSGLRPGEKLYEELLIGDNPSSTTHPRIMKAHEHMHDWETLSTKLAELQDLAQHNAQDEILDVFRALNIGYAPSAASGFSTP